jgi:hypothetical protein
MFCPSKEKYLTEKKFEDKNKKFWQKIYSRRIIQSFTCNQ